MPLMRSSVTHTKGFKMHAVEVFADGSAAFFSNREVPWHRLGTITDGAQTVDQALRLAQLDWDVVKSEDPVQVPVLTESGVVMVAVDDRYITYRDHPKMGMQGLGVVGKQYTVTQNREAFDFLNALTHESGAVFETAGSLRGGTQVFMSMKMPQHISLGGGQDTVDLYLVCSTSHDGSKAFTVFITAVRPVCANTVAMGLQQATQKWYLKHTSNVKGKVQQAREALAMVIAYQDEFQQEAERLISTAMTERGFARFAERLFPTSDKMSSLQIMRTEAARGELTGLWHAPTQQNVANTRWAAFNAVTEWADWVKPVKAGKQDADVARAERVFLGAAEPIKQKAYALLNA